jgi:PilZ domain
MGKRHEARQELIVPVRIFGTDAHGQIFSETVHTSDVSRGGVQLTGVRAELKTEEIIGLTYENKKGHFRVRWAGQFGTPQAGRVGLLNLTPEKSLWNIAFPDVHILDSYKWQAGERRKDPRVKVVLSVELQPEHGALMWAHSADLSLGGCFLEMAIPLKVGEKLKIGMWIDGTKVWLQGRVASSTPGFGVGFRFTDLSDKHILLLKNFLNSKTLTGRP